MRPKPVVPSSVANRDVDEAIGYYVGQGCLESAIGFIDALEKAYQALGRHPAAGSPRYTHELGITDLRFWPVPGYPYLVFYVEREDHVHVWRVLHAQRDIPAWLSE